MSVLAAAPAPINVLPIIDCTTKNTYDDSFDIPTGVYYSKETDDRVEVFGGIALGDSRINMKLVSSAGREIPANYHTPGKAHDAKGGLLVHMDWVGAERLDGIEDFRYDPDERTILMNSQTFVQGELPSMG